MADRYQRVFSLEGDLYAQGSPVLIKAGALLVDSTTNKVLAQLKFQNISDQIIKAIKVALYPMDTVGRALGDTVEYQYLDLNEKRDAEFGSKVPIYFENTSVRSFSVKVTEIAFADNSVWNCTTEWIKLPQQKELSAVLPKELKEQYRITIGNDSADYVAEQTQDLWLCTCGAINRGHEAQCHKCNLAYAILVAELDEEKLTKAREIRLAEIARKREEERIRQEEVRIKREEAAAKKREEDKIVAKRCRKKILITLLIVALVVGTILASMCVWKNIIVPNQIKNDFIESYGQDVYDRYGVVEDETASFIVEYGFDIYDKYGVISATDADFIVEFGVELYDKYGVISATDANFINEYGQEIYDEYGYLSKEDVNILVEYGREVFDRYQLINNPEALFVTVRENGEIICLGNADVDVGTTVFFGNYEQDGHSTNGKEPIEWIVADVQTGRVLLISRYGIDEQSYNTELKPVTWEDCSLRTWLNEKFIELAFSDKEVNLIQDTTVKATGNPNYETVSGNDVQDQIFVPSYGDLERLISSMPDEMRCIPTYFAVAQGVENYFDGYCPWWLREPGKYQYSAVYVNEEGSVEWAGGAVEHMGWINYKAVRPAMWIDLTTLDAQ